MTRARVVWLAQLVLGVAVAGFVGRAIASHWAEFRALEFPVRLHAGWVAAAAGTVLCTYALLIAAWRLVIVGWGERLTYRRAAAIWTVANLGRYLPGKVWSVAGLAVLAQRAGVAGWAGIGAAVAMQALAVGSGVTVTAVTAPGTLSAAGIVLGMGTAVATLAVLASPAAAARVHRLTGRELRALPLSTVLVAGGVTTAAWAGYGVAFWCLARGILGPAPLSLSVATGVFAGGYIVGLLALFAPGGVGVREAIFIALLAPSLGSGGAIVLSVASRVLLTVTEAGAAGVGWWLGRGAAGPPGASAPAGGRG